MSVQEYIERHDLTRKVEEALNAAVKAKAEEPLAFVVRATTRDGGRAGRGTWTIARARVLDGDRRARA